MARVNFTEARIKALQPLASLRDAVVPNLIVRAGTAGKRVYALHKRFPGARNPTRRVIAEVGSVTLDGARDTARRWLEFIRQGVDPAQEAQRRADEVCRAVELQRAQQQSRFAQVAEDYLKRKVAGQRRARAVERIVRNVLIKAWGERPIGTISRRDVVELVEQINDRPAPIYAHAVFVVAHTLFNWAVNRGTYQLEHSPCYGIKVADLVSRTKQPRQRVLSDDEVLAFWKATGRLGYPWKQMFRLLLVTGARRSEASHARWVEINEREALWSIPPERFKSNSTHLVPLSDSALALLATVPRFNSGDYLFTCTYGRTPAAVLHQAKLRLDALMLRYLRALARLRGNDPATVTLAPHQTHDLRRVVRSKMAQLGVAEHLAEQALGHGKRNLLQRTYNQYRYVKEVSVAMQLWADELKRMVTVPRRSHRSRRAGGVR